MARNHPNSGMSNAGFRPIDSPVSDFTGNPDFEISDIMDFSDWMEEEPEFMVSGYTQNQEFAGNEGFGVGGRSTSSHGGANSGESSSVREKKEAKEKVAFKTKSEVEILDDGFKWRKYGKKMVKNSPNPRNYYKCSVEGCPVKKRIERDREDSRYVITTYEGIHNHQGPTRF